MSPVDRGEPPEAGAIRPFDFPEVARTPLDNGLDLRVARLPRIPVVSLYLFMRAGEGALDSERAGLAVLSGNAMDGGTRRRTGAELAEALEGIGARMSVSTGWEGTSASLSCLADRLDEAMALLAEAVLEPDFPEAEVERARDQQLAGLRQRAMDPGALAADHAARVMYAADVPYARHYSGTPESVTPLGRDHARGYAEACWRPERGGLVVAGDVDPGEMVELAERHLAGWTGVPALEADFQSTSAVKHRRVVLVDRPGSVQASIRVGHVATVRSDPDVEALTVLNAVLGGTFTSRLNLNLRERHGFTYGVRSRFSFRSRPGPFTVSTDVGNESAPAAVREIFNELEGIVDGGPTEEEVDAARDYIAGVFPLRVETAGQVASQLAESVIYGLPDDYHHTYRDRIRAVTVEEAAAAGRRHIRPQEAQAVVVGDAASLAEGLEGLRLGPLEVVEAS